MVRHSDPRALLPTSLPTSLPLFPIHIPATPAYLNTCSCLSLDAMMMKLPSGLMTMSWILEALARDAGRSNAGVTHQANSSSRAGQESTSAALAGRAKPVADWEQGAGEEGSCPRGMGRAPMQATKTAKQITPV